MHLGVAGMQHQGLLEACHERRVQRVTGMVRVTGLFVVLVLTSGRDMSIAMMRGVSSRLSTRPLTTTIASSAMYCPITS
ncbi:hypothetical protein GCM10029963_20120 [Micromonospora andamanensis]